APAPRRLARDHRRGGRRPGPALPRSRLRRRAPLPDAPPPRRRRPDHRAPRTRARRSPGRHRGRARTELAGLRRRTDPGRDGVAPEPADTPRRADLRAQSLHARRAPGPRPPRRARTPPRPPAPALPARPGRRPDRPGRGRPTRGPPGTLYSPAAQGSNSPPPAGTRSSGPSWSPARAAGTRAPAAPAARDPFLADGASASFEIRGPGTKAPHPRAGTRHGAPPRAASAHEPLRARLSERPGG